MNKLCKFSSKYLFAGALTVVFLFILTWEGTAGYVQGKNFYSALTSYDTTKPGKGTDSLGKPKISAADTIPSKQRTDSVRLSKTDSLAAIDTIPLKQKIDSLPPVLQTDSLDAAMDTIPSGDSVVSTDTFSLRLSNDTLDAPVFYEAEDSAVVLIKDEKIIMYGKTKTDYKEVTLTAPVVEMNQVTQVVTAIGSKDSLGQIIERANFKDGEQEFQSDSIKFNFKTQRGLTKNTFTQQGELFVNGEDIKKYDENTVYIRRGVFTTCNLDEPHFGFRANKLKVINKKLAVSGPAHPEFEGVPIPVYLPFGFYPLSQGRHSGFLPPRFTTNDYFGVGLEGLGYYKVFNDYWDMTVDGNVYSYGGWQANFKPSYRVRYRYSGSANFTIMNTKYNFKGDPDYNKSRTYNLNLTHSVDNKARPGQTFSANINAGSTRFNRGIANSPELNFTNTTSSSVAFSKSWLNKPYNLTLSANHSQNNSQHIINLSLPSLGFTVNTIYPFQRKEVVGEQKWYEKLGIAYNGTFRNQVSFYDTVNSQAVYGKPIFKHLLDTLQWGGQHSIPITLSLPPILGGALMVAPNVSFSQIIMGEKVRKSWNDNTKRVDTAITKGIFADQQASFGINLSTAVFGTYQFKKSRVVALRHVIRPSIGINYRPDLSKANFYSVQVDTNVNRKPQRASIYESSLYGYYSEGRYGGMSFQFDNNLEMKVRTKDTTGENPTKKIRLIDGFGFSTSYNFFADSFRLEPISIYFRSTLFEKINITANTSIDPYQVDQFGEPIDKYAWQGEKFSLGRINSGNIAISTSFQSKPKDEKKDAEKKKQMDEQMNDPTLAADRQQLLDYMRQNPAEFVDFNIPWSFNLGFSLNFYRTLKSDYTYETKTNSNVNLGGSFSLTPKWNLTANGYYDFSTMKLQTLTLSIARDLHCWQMSISVIPVGLYRSFNIVISPKASVLQDLRINRNRSFYSQ